MRTIKSIGHINTIAVIDIGRSINIQNKITAITTEIFSSETAEHTSVFRHIHYWFIVSKICQWRRSCHTPHAVGHIKVYNAGIFCFRLTCEQRVRRHKQFYTAAVISKHITKNSKSAVSGNPFYFPTLISINSITVRICCTDISSAVKFDTAVGRVGIGSMRTCSLCTEP